MGTLNFWVMMDIWPYKCLYPFLFIQKGEKRFACTTLSVKNGDLSFGELRHVIGIWSLTPLPSAAPSVTRGCLWSWGGVHESSGISASSSFADQLLLLAASLIAIKIRGMEIGECRWLRERSLGCAFILPPVDCSLRTQRLLVGKHACTHIWKYSKLSIILINNSSKTSLLWNKMVTSSEKRWPLHSLLTSKQLIFSKMHSTRASGSLGLRTATNHRVKLP